MKYLLSALLLCGAFFSYQSHGQQQAPLQCEPFETPLDAVGGCGTLAPEQACELTSIRAPTSWGYGSPYTFSSVTAIMVPLTRQDMTNDGPYTCSYNQTRTHATSVVTTLDLDTSCPYSDLTKTAVGVITQTTTRVSSTGPANGQLICDVQDIDPTYTTKNVTFTLTYEVGGEFQCPASHPLGPYDLFENGNLVDSYCYRIPDIPPCDDPLGNCDPDEETPPDCENDPLNPCPPPPCVQGGNGMMVCKDNPDDKCWVDEWGHTQCEEGCGFVGENFFCATQPDPEQMPDFAKCKFTFNGYACPSEPDDEIADPDKALPDMKKQDFKDANVGVETRQDKTNELLETQIAEWNRESNETQAGIDKLNQTTKDGFDGLGSVLSNDLDGLGTKLDGIGDELKKLNDVMEPKDIEPSPAEPESWYESEYPDGLKGIWDEKQPLLMATPLFSFVEQFNINPNGNPPDFEMCFNLGALGNYGCDSFEIPQWVWNAIKVFILFTAAILCRAAVTGV